MLITTTNPRGVAYSALQFTFCIYGGLLADFQSVLEREGVVVEGFQTAADMTYFTAKNIETLDFKNSYIFY